MKLFRYVVVAFVAFTLAMPVGISAREGDEAGDTPEVSESPDASDSPEPLESPDEDEDEDETPSPSVSPDDDDDEDEDEDEQESSTPRPSVTVRPSRSPEVEDREDRSGPNRGSERAEDEDEREAEETPEVSVPPALEDDVDEIVSSDDDVRRIEVNEEEGRVEVKYRLRAKLFGLIDVPYELETRIERKEGELKAEARGPWWLLFAVDHADEVQVALETDPTLPGATNQGTVLSVIISVLKSLAR